MKVDYDVMLEMVLHYCNQDYTPKKVPKGLQLIVVQMCEYVENSEYSNLKSVTVDKYSRTFDDKELFNKFSGMLSAYKRLKTV